MSKSIVTVGAVVGMTVGGALPLLWGDGNLFDVPSLLLTMVGGFGGIWLAFVLLKRYG